MHILAVFILISCIFPTNIGHLGQKNLLGPFGGSFCDGTTEFSCHLCTATFIICVYK